jgi:hypothetical protein
MSLQLIDALSIMEDTLNSFDISFVSCDLSRKTGGEIINLKRCVRVGANHNRKQNDTTVIKPVDRDSHPYPVHNFLILSVNGQEVFI